MFAASRGSAVLATQLQYMFPDEETMYLQMHSEGNLVV